MTHSKFPWTNHPHTPTAVFDGDGRRIIDQWVAPEGWQDIETAPKDEMFIWAYLRDGQWSVGLAYRNISGGWSDAYGSDAPRHATHWMPLPAPPSDAPAPTPLDPDTAAANAVMIAAIPEMLAVLKEISAHRCPTRNGEWITSSAAHAARAVLASIGRTL